MPAHRPRASFEPISPLFDIKKLVESTPNFSYVDRFEVDKIQHHGMEAFEKLILLHVIKGGKPLVIDGFDERLENWTFTPEWLRDNIGDKVENARVLGTKEYIPLTIGHYLKNMAKLTNQFFDKPGAYREKGRQRVYLKDIDCPTVWEDKLREHIPSALFYLNESTGEVDGPGAVPDPTGKRLGRGIAKAGDLMSSLPRDMRAQNLMCYIGHESTYTPAHREMCASLGQNIMVEASGMVSTDGKPEKPGSSVWFMTESKDRHVVSEYWLSVLGHDIEVENHFAQIAAWKKAPFNVYIVEQKPGDFILIPPLAPHQVWNRGTRTMKVAWNRTTVETLEMALNEALPRSRIVCRDEQYKNKAIIYYTLQKYSGLLSVARQQALQLPEAAGQQLLYTGKIKQLIRDFKRLFNLYKQVLLSEMFSPDDTPKGIEYLPFDSNVTCAYCRSNIFNRFLTCPSCKDMLGHQADDSEGDPYDVCLDCYAMGRSCACLSNLKWVEQFKWKELASKYESWRKLIIALDSDQITDKTPKTLSEERDSLGKKTLAEVCKEQLKRRPWKDVHKGHQKEEDPNDDDEEIIVDDNGVVKKTTKKRSKAWLKNNSNCHVCCNRQPNWKMAACTTCDKWWCYGTLWRGWDKMPIEIMEDPNWICPHCLGICFTGACRTEGKSQPYEPKGTLLGHDTKKVADARSVEALVDFSVSNLNWLKDDDDNRVESNRVKRAKAEAQMAKENDHAIDEDDGQDEQRVGYEYSPGGDSGSPADSAIDPTLDPALVGASIRGSLDDEDSLAKRLQQATSTLPPPAAMMAGAPASGAPDGYAPVSAAGYIPPAAQMYPQPGETGTYVYPGYLAPTSVEPRDGDEVNGIRPFKRRRDDEDEEEEDGGEDINMQKGPKAKKPRMSAAGFKSTDLADDDNTAPKARNEAQRQYGKEKERKALEKAKSEGRFIMLQARLRGKKRVVKLAIPGARLGQLLAQQAVKAALGGEEADAEHEFEEGAAQEDDEPANVVLLKSDVAPKKNKQDLKAYQKGREDKGLIITSKTKKALIPFERDENYDYKGREWMPDAKQKRKSRQGNFDYEEVDIGSDDEVERGEDALAVPIAKVTSRRSLPGYLQNRHADDQDMLDEIRVAMKPQAAASSPLQLSAPPAKRRVGRPAGKRPTMRPMQRPPNLGLDGAADEKELNEVLDQAENGTFIPAEKANWPSPFHPKAAVNGSSSAAGTKKTNAPRSRSNEIAEQNRLAKLQALESFNADEGRAAQRGNSAHVNSRLGTISMAEVISDDDEESDDGVDSVPARREQAV